MASRWGLIGSDSGWYGSGIRTTASRKAILSPVPEPIIFKPTDLSNCIIWYDATNPDSIVTDVDNTTVLTWGNLGTAGGELEPSGGFNTGLTNVDLLNGLNSIKFEANYSMVMKNAGAYAQNKTIFILSKGLTDLSGATPIYNYFSGESGGDTVLTSSYDISNNFVYQMEARGNPSGIGLQTINAPNPYNNVYGICYRTSVEDISQNLISINGVSQPLSISQASGFYYDEPTSYYVNDNTYGTSQDIGEIIWYDRVLSDSEVLQVTAYLTEKWALVEPPLPPVFIPTDISGLQLWFNADNSASITLDGSNVSSWANDGLLSISANSNFSGAVTTVTDVGGKTNVQFQPGSDLEFYTALPYNSRTQFVVFKNFTSLGGGGDTLLPFIYGSEASYGMQSGVKYDSMTETFQYFLGYVEVGSNPIGVTTENPLSNATLATFVTNSADGSLSQFYLNNSSNINSSTNGLDEFNKDPISYHLSYGPQGQGMNLCELLEYDSVLSSQDISTVTSYLGNKWGLSLPIPPSPLPPGENTSIIYGAFIEGEYPNFYWCDNYGNVEIPYVLASGYDGTTAYRDGTPVVVTNVFYS